MERRRIQQLSPSLVNRIAAGEVIERPAAVVKELVENALDAGATSITVEVEDGGRALVRVIDDGAGIPPEELPLAFASHATSKITSDEDLFRIATMGFRGEALASIGSVSQARILSRTAQTPSAWEVFNRGGDISDPQAAAGNVGTTIEVRNLFFNTPARRKFIKGTATEYGHISETVLRLSLPHPRVAFKLTHNGRVSLTLAATSDPLERFLAAWPAEFRELRLEIDVRDAELRISGIVGMPELARPTPRYQYLYLNGRHIRDKFIMHALREAYRGLTEPGRHPAAVLILDMPPADVDVNVHPTKSEVRFRDGGRIHGLVHSGVREKLLGSDLTPIAQPKSDSGLGLPGVATSGETPRDDVRARLADFFKGRLDLAADSSPGRPPGASDLPGNGASSLPSFPPLGPGTSAYGAPARITSSFNAWASASKHALPDPTEAASRPVATGESGDLPDRSLPPEAPATAATAANVERLLPAGLPALQLHNSYLVAESPDGLVIIDQHALHERIMYEDLLARVSRGPMEAQRLLIPQTIEASSSQIAMLEQIQPLLAKLGIDVSPFGPGAVAVHAFPSFLERLDPALFVRELLEKGEQELLDLHEEELLHEVLDMMACKAAVKAGDPLTPAEIEALLARRELIERSSNCPHGRPTTLRLSLRDLEKQFKRS